MQTSRAPGPPIQPAPHTIVPTSERQLATTHWLLAATESPGRARREWHDTGVTMLKTGTLFSAIRITERLVHAAADTDEPSAVATYLSRVFWGGPVIHDPRRCRYYALTPASTAGQWPPSRDTEGLGRGGYVGIPRPGLGITEPSSYMPYWLIPMESPGELCPPLAVAALVERGQSRLTAQESTEQGDDQ